MRRLALITTAAALAVAVVSGCNISSGTKGSGTGNDAFQHAEDVTITSCTADSEGDLHASVSVTNNSSGPSNYIITIAFDSADGATQLDTGLVAVDNLTPGQSSTQDATSLTTATPGYKCKIADATRLGA